MAKKKPVSKTRTTAGKTTKRTTKKPAKKVSASAARTPRPAPKAAKAAKVAKAPKVAKAASPVEPKDPKKIKSPLSRKELADYRSLLMTKRAEILGDMTSMSREALRMNESANLSHMPLHMADVGTDNYEQELTLGLVESERRMLQEINEALQRIADGTFGVCQSTGKPITKARLAAKPWAKYCIEAAREMERTQRRF